LTPPSKEQEIQRLFEKMKDNLVGATQLLEQEHTEIAVSRAYYAMFYITEALLLSKDLSFSKHSGTIAAFGQHFVKTGIFKPEFHEMLLKSSQERTEGDYRLTETFSEAEAKEALQRAKTYCEALVQHLRKNKLLTQQ
jgi:uncharacterized protein (UPF0332 family)